MTEAVVNLLTSLAFKFFRKEVFIREYERTSELGNRHRVKAYWREMPKPRGANH
jgi:hypothetical protein